MKSVDDENEWFARLFTDNSRSLVRYLSRFVHSSGVAEDLTQESFARLFAATRSLIDSPRGYLYRTARNLALDHLRHRQVVPMESVAELEALEIASDCPSAESEVGSREELAVVRAAIEELPPKCRMVFLLLRVEGRSCKEIAAQMALSETMVRKYARRALEHCQTRLAHANGDRPRRDGR